ncbi:hypothetical protein NHX12_009045 [Muraenolepis orangiensis]|uniref:Uncharacterized protein n=1 Tax=Muraenolepis orangiensis TaxID=630683 RepID=A0A9Q0DMJ2_9TELE|nr:hypothetical protein NHX12_009045 [Muraenolepis orangiensis]
MCERDGVCPSLARSLVTTSHGACASAPPGTGPGTALHSGMQRGLLRAGLQVEVPMHQRRSLRLQDRLLPMPRRLPRSRLQLRTVLSCAPAGRGCGATRPLGGASVALVEWATRASKDVSRGGMGRAASSHVTVQRRPHVTRPQASVCAPQDGRGAGVKKSVMDRALGLAALYSLTSSKLDDPRRPHQHRLTPHDLIKAGRPAEPPRGLEDRGQGPKETPHPLRVPATL